MLRIAAVAGVVAGLAVGVRAVAATPPPPDGQVAPAVVVTPGPSSMAPDSPAPTTWPDSTTTDPGDDGPGAAPPSPSAPLSPSGDPSPSPSPPGGHTDDPEDHARPGVVTVTRPPAAVPDDHESGDSSDPTATGRHR